MFFLFHRFIVVILLIRTWLKLEKTLKLFNGPPKITQEGPLMFLIITQIKI